MEKITVRLVRPLQLVQLAGSFALALSTLLAAAPANSNITIRLWNIPRKDATDPRDLASRRVFEAFCRAHPHITVRALSPLKIQGPAAEGNEFLAVAGGVAPDVFQLFGRKIADYHRQGFLAPLDDYLKQYAAEEGTPYRGINAPAIVWEPCRINNHIYCVPSSYYSMALMCQRNLFGKAGVPLVAPKDWDELYRLARRLTYLPEKEPDAKPGETPVYGLNLLIGNVAGWQFLQYVWSSGGEVVRAFLTLPDGRTVEAPVPPVDWRAYHIQTSDELSYERVRADLTQRLIRDGLPTNYSYDQLSWRLVVDEPPGVHALEFYRKIMHQPWLRVNGVEFDLTPEMLREGRATVPGSQQVLDLRDPAIRKRIYHGVVQTQQPAQRDLKVQFAMRIGTLEETSSLEDATQLVALPFPSRTRDLPPAAFIAGHYLAVNAAQPDPRVRDAAWQYIKFVTGPEAQAIRTSTYIEFGLAEFVRPAALEALGYAYIIESIPPERQSLWNLVERHARIEPYCAGFQHVMTRELGMAIDAMLSDRPVRSRSYEYQRDPAAILAEISSRVNQRILGRMPDEEVRRRSRIGWIIAAVVVALLAFGTYATIRLAVHLHGKAAELEGFGVGGKTIGRTIAIILFLTPAVATIVLWRYIPLAHGTVIAFQDFKILGGSRFVGLRNFIEAASAPEFWRYVMQTFQYLAYSLGLGFFAPIILAILLTEIPRGKVFFRTVYYLPAVTTGLVTMFLWKQLLYDPSPTGLINSIILAFNDFSTPVVVVIKSVGIAALLAAIISMTWTALQRDVSGWGRWVPLAAAALITWLIVVGARDLLRESPSLLTLLHWFAAPWDFKPQEFLQDRHLALLWVVIPTIWAHVGPGCLVYLAALKGVPDEQYEAADLDGAGIWSKVVHIVFPNLSALILINVVGAVVGAMQASQNIFVMTGGGPEDATMTVGLSIWINAFMYLNFGLATAQAWILGSMLIGFTLYQLRIMNRMQFSAAATRK